MKLKKIVRQTIRNLIMENASILDTLPVSNLQRNKFIIVADMQAPQSEIGVYLCNVEDYDEEFGEVTDYFGKMNISNIGKRTMQVTGSGISSRYRRKGFGALLYNVALALCTSQNLWLMSDREQVTSQADRIWDTWKSMPDVYVIDQTDHKQPDETHYATLYDDYDPDVDFFLTKTRDDDFNQASFEDNHAKFSSYSDDDPRAQWGDMVKDWWYFFDDDYKEDFLESGLTKRYMMKDAANFIKALESQDLLYKI